MSRYLGLVPLNNQLGAAIVTRDSNNTPTDASAAPTFRVYGETGLMANSTGSLSLQDPGPSGGTVAAASDASPIVITSNGHGLSTGTQVTISGVNGNTAANGNWIVTVLDANTFSLNNSTGNGIYTSGGTWHVSGLYSLSLTPTAANGYLSGQNYTILVTATVSGITRAEAYTFTVV